MQKLIVWKSIRYPCFVFLGTKASILPSEENVHPYLSYGRRNKSVFRRTARFSRTATIEKNNLEALENLLTLRSKSGKDLIQINLELLIEVLADRPNGDVIHARVHEILDRADTMLDRPAGIPDFYPCP